MEQDNGGSNGRSGGWPQHVASTASIRTRSHLLKFGLRSALLRATVGLAASLATAGSARASSAAVDPTPANANPSAIASDDRIKTLFDSWRTLDDPERSVIAIPSIRPVSESTLTISSSFGVRSDPFTGRAEMHAGVDLPGPIGTPIYATAAGIVVHAGVAGGYGNMVEIDHGHGIATRYGHLSKVLVSPDERVARGQEIGLMGSTGRSTGSHLHYEVRIAGRAVDPMPYLQSTDFLQALGASPPRLETAAVRHIPESDD